MRLKSILKEIDKIIELWKGTPKEKEKALVKLAQLRNRIALKVQEQERKQSNTTAHELAKWYYKLWDGKIPEGNFGRVVKVFASLLEEFKLSEEEIKETYNWWLQLKEENVPPQLRKKYSIVLIDREVRSITDMRGRLRYVRGLMKKIQNTSSGWVSEEFQHDDIYGKGVVSAEELWDEENELPF